METKLEKVDTFVQGCGSDGCSYLDDQNARKEVREFKVRIPTYVKPDDAVTISVGGGGSFRPFVKPASCVKDIIDTMNIVYSPMQIVVRVATSQKVHYYKGKELENLPVTQILRLLGGDAQILQTTKFEDIVNETPYVISHNSSLRLTVK